MNAAKIYHKAWFCGRREEDGMGRGVWMEARGIEPLGTLRFPTQTPPKQCPGFDSGWCDPNSNIETGSI